MKAFPRPLLLVLGLILSAAHVEKTCKEQKIENVQTVLCTPTSTELPPESIDLAFTCDVYHHFELPYKSLASIHRALRDGEVELMKGQYVLRFVKVW